MKPKTTLPILSLIFACGGPPLERDLPLFPTPTDTAENSDPSPTSNNAPNVPNDATDSPEISSEEWTLTWEDNFDGAEDSSPDSSRWDYNIGGDGWGNNQLEHNTDRPVNVSTDGQGNLRITALRENFGGNAYTSARILTRNRFEQAYGRFEARIKLPTGQGIWPAFWLLGATIGEVGWPECGEIDILELRGQDPGEVLGSVHGPGYSGANPISGRYRLPGGASFGDAFHTFAVEWDPEQIVWYIDNSRFHAVTRSDLPAGTRWAFEDPFFVILNVAVGGHFVGNPDTTTQFPQTMWIDYVRIYRRTP